MSTRQPADDDRGRPQSHLFLVRVWTSERGRGAEFRSNVRDVTSGATRSFRNWSDVAAFMMARVEENEALAAGRLGQDILERNL